mmetsp:Transcript_10763/g.17557  ORF Transcript_10763/g.17557 Transcript_10763/m.17557 type:complete len:477 (-) Transcript_10763:172-1602(-)
MEDEEIKDSIWYHIRMCSPMPERDEIAQMIGLKLIDESKNLWIELRALKDIIYDMAGGDMVIDGLWASGGDGSNNTSQVKKKTGGKRGITDARNFSQLHYNSSTSDGGQQNEAGWLMDDLLQCKYFTAETIGFKLDDIREAMQLEIKGLEVDIERLNIYLDGGAAAVSAFDASRIAVQVIGNGRRTGTKDEDRLADHVSYPDAMGDEDTSNLVNQFSGKLAIHTAATNDPQNTSNSGPFSCVICGNYVSSINPSSSSSALGINKKAPKSFSVGSSTSTTTAIVGNSKRSVPAAGKTAAVAAAASSSITASDAVCAVCQQQPQSVHRRHKDSCGSSTGGMSDVKDLMDTDTSKRINSNSNMKKKNSRDLQQPLPSSSVNFNAMKSSQSEQLIPVRSKVRGEASEENRNETAATTGHNNNDDSPDAAAAKAKSKQKLGHNSDYSTSSGNSISSSSGSTSKFRAKLNSARSELHFLDEF